MSSNERAATPQSVSWSVMPNDFMIALRGYDMTQVDRVLAQADEALSSGSDTLRMQARHALHNASFRQRWRGYARHEVDQAIQQRLQRLT